MQAFCTKGWEHYGKCTSIMYLSTAHGGHVFHPTATTKPVPDEDEEDDFVAVDPPAGSSIIISSSSSIIVGPKCYNFRRLRQLSIVIVSKVRSQMSLEECKFWTCIVLLGLRAKVQVKGLSIKD